MQCNSFEWRYVKSGILFTQQVIMNKYFINLFLAVGVLLLGACNKDQTLSEDGYTYFQVAFKGDNADWRDTSFIVRTKDPQLIQRATAQLSLPVAERQIVFGKLLAGNAGYNKNASHSFIWHFKKDEWDLVDVTAEIYDGKPFTDVDSNLTYWLETMTRYGAWGSYIKTKLVTKP